MRRYILLSFVLFFSMEAIMAQPRTENPTEVAKPAYVKPEVILVMLHLSTNKIDALKIRGMEEDIPMVIEGDEEVNLSIIKDFARNFKFCPVYFFYDSCYEKAKSKQWSEITFYDYESLTMKKKVGTNSFPSYFFAEVSYATPPTHLEVDNTITDRMVDRFQGDEDATSTRNYGINLYDEDFVPLRRKLAFTDISLRRRGELFGQKKYVFEGAMKFDKKLRKRFGQTVKE